MIHHPQPVTEEGTAGKRAGRVYRQDPNLAASLPELLYRLVDQGAFARPGWPRNSYGEGLACAGVEFLHEAATGRSPRFNQEIAFATALWSPFNTRDGKSLAIWSPKRFWTPYH